MQCPHCSVHFHESWTEVQMVYGRSAIGWQYRVALCPNCSQHTIALHCNDYEIAKNGGVEPYTWVQVFPVGSNRGPVSSEVPEHIRQDYIEACRVLPFSAKASAALSRRCLQTILHGNGYKARDLAIEIDLLLNEADPKKGIPQSLRSTIDGIRNFGNFGAHPITDVTSLQIIDVEPEEAEWCLEVIEEIFEHFYIQPARAKAQKVALDAKLAAAGKPPSR